MANKDPQKEYERGLEEGQSKQAILEIKGREYFLKRTLGEDPLFLCAASDLNGRKARRTTICITQELPELKNLQTAEVFYLSQASDLYDVLNHSLPQGTRHQLLILMLEGHKNLYRGI